jgi:hypothetical protein
VLRWKSSASRDRSYGSQDESADTDGDHGPSDSEVVADRADFGRQIRQPRVDALFGNELEAGNDEHVDRLEGSDTEQHAARRGDPAACRDDDGSECSG